MSSNGDREAQAREVTERLRSAYGRHDPEPRGHVTDSLVGTILSQHTSDRNSSLAFRRLKDAFPHWEGAASASPEAIAEAIRPGGLANIKAERILRVLTEIRSRRGTYDLDPLRSEPLAAGWAFLESLPGVGPKTAACVLLFSCALPALPVDTHVHRVSLRLGLIPPRTTANAAHALLERLVPAEDVYDFHVNMIAHGRQVCVARAPGCGVCPLLDICDYGRSLSPMIVPQSNSDTRKSGV